MKAIATVSVLTAAGFIGLGSVTTSAGAAVLADYEFGTVATPSYASTDLDLNSVATDFAPASGLGSSGNWPNTTNGITTATGNPAPEFAQKPITGSSSGTGTPESAYATNAYWSFTLTPDSGFEANLTSLSFDLHINNSGRPISYYLASSVGGFSNPVGSVVTAQTSSSHPSFDLSGTPFQSLQTPVEFRFYMWSDQGGSSGSRWSFDNVTLEGNTSSTVPEPATLTLLSAVGLVTVRRRPSTNAELSQRIKQ